MQSADFRIIPHRIAIGIPTPENDLYRYLIAYASADQSRFVALNQNGEFVLVDDEKLATRFPSLESAQQKLQQAREAQQLQAVGQMGIDTRDIL